MGRRTFTGVRTGRRHCKSCDSYHRDQMFDKDEHGYALSRCRLCTENSKPTVRTMSLASPTRPAKPLSNECSGCFDEATMTHSIGHPCCLKCYGADLAKLMSMKEQYCQYAIK